MPQAQAWADKAYYDFDFPKQIFLNLKTKDQGEERYLLVESFIINPVVDLTTFIINNTNNIDLVKWILPLAIVDLKEDLEVGLKSYKDIDRYLIDIIYSTINHDNLEILKILLENKYTYDFMTTSLFDFLILAFYHGYTDIVEYLINNYYNEIYNENPKKFEELIIRALDENKDDIAKFLIKYAKEHDIEIDLN